MSFVPYASPMILYRFDVVVVVSRNRRWHAAVVFHVITLRVSIVIYYNIVLFFSGAARKTGPRGGGAIFEGFPPRSCGSCVRVS